ncbi:hypothetical protein [Acinetobacter sp. TUM15512]|uniref:hypothetical protein n=1 Tax=Acinetobacter sp. TUM15512 TaxID=2609155 RepID=UPI00125D2A69|nr:hypothetical protein [Acinetobacter sp. TUM15512]
MALTQKKKDFARAKLQGKSNIDAAIEAGYAERSAGAKGSQLAVDPDVVAYLASLNFQGGGGLDATPLGEAAIQAEFKDMADVNNSLDFLQWVYKNPRLDQKVRIEAAKAALPYEFGKVGETGVKKGREDAASEVSENDDDFATAGNQRKARTKQVVS